MLRRPVELAALIRQLGTKLAMLFEANGVYPSQADMLTGPNGLVIHKEHFQPGTLAWEWMSKVNFFSDEIMPGWKLGYFLVDGGSGFRLVIAGTDYTVITDEHGVIYQAPTPAQGTGLDVTIPASQFQGAAPYNQFKDNSVLRRSKQLFMPVNFGTTCPTCTNQCFICDTCSYCVTQCCPGLSCQNMLPFGRCYYNAGCGGTPGCAYMVANCGCSGKCTACATKLFGGCCQSVCQGCHIAC